ncbi:tetratricopeptide repeat protein (macronuclear) [Tetrahymena thermophila SB210]|uniref:Tetratricopeptide repeat protein n=1 Tax=Tetrahymena thermophila (strain SB210) TaxID=312017 RepID=Q23MI8_TETTS|nr:tetratricopeptide repeat protein [Tetrahymena thermophila SB210]EAR97651.2 tetratricopeptide repeat protein [Tetrahymena thermophila SB210]|eukprot:XP_001017896.2 tetratricopeptide repeat protein [Tetrahymena thermophila SB210]
MRIKYMIIGLASLPIILVFTIAIMSQYVALIYLNDYNNQIQNNLFLTQIMFSQIFSQQISFQLSQELQKIPINVRTLNQYLAKLIQGQVKSNPKHKSSMVPIQQLHDNQADPQILKMFKRSRILVNCWFQSNYSTVSQMDQIGQQKLKILDQYHALSRAFQYQDIQRSRINQKTLAISDFFEAFQYEGIFSITGVNSTLKVSHKAPSCIAGNDVRCRYWYTQTAQQESVQIYPPSLIYGYSPPYLSTLSCQRIMLFNQTTQQEDLQSVICSGLYFNQTQNYFQNFASSTEQVYFLEPRSQILLYDSKQPLGMTSIETLNNSEFQYLQSQNEAIKFNNTLNQNYVNSIFKNVSNLITEYLDEANSFSQTFSYDRNGTKTIVILNPVQIIDKSPQLQNLQNNKKFSHYLIKFPYVQVNIISNENLRIHASKIENFFKNYFLAFNISFGILGLISILVIIYYTSKIKKIFYTSIDQLTDILIKMNDKKLSSSIFDIISADQQLSLDASQLYDSFKQIYQIMLYSSEDFYNQNDTEQLLKLNENIEFFKQFGNIKAVGITYNNIGSILLKQEHYFQALENFQSSIIYARYEIQEFLNLHPSFTLFDVLQSFSYFQLEQQECNQEIDQLITFLYKNQTEKQRQDLL